MTFFYIIGIFEGGHLKNILKQQIMLSMKSSCPFYFKRYTTSGWIQTMIHKTYTSVFSHKQSPACELNSNIVYNNLKLWLRTQIKACRRPCQQVTNSTSNLALRWNKERLTLLKSTVLFSLLTSFLFSAQAGADWGETTWPAERDCYYRIQTITYTVLGRLGERWTSI